MVSDVSQQLYTQSHQEELQININNVMVIFPHDETTGYTVIHAGNTHKQIKRELFDIIFKCRAG